jgi:hypothetical protein
MHTRYYGRHADERLARLALFVRVFGGVFVLGMAGTMILSMLYLRGLIR